MGRERSRAIAPLVRTTLRLSADLWREVRGCALEQRIALQDIVESQLWRHLKTTKGGGG